MAFPPFPAHPPGPSDYDLGRRLATDDGMITIEVTAANYVAVQTALHKAKDGDFETAGRLFREHLQSGPLHIAGTTWKRQQRASARKRKGIKSPLSHAIYRLIPYLPARTLECLLDAFHDEDTIADLYEARTNPINIRIQEVLENKQRVDYRTRSGKERSVSFKRLKNILCCISKDSAKT